MLRMRPNKIAKPNRNLKYVDFIIFNTLLLKGIVSRDFGGLQMILMDRIVVPIVRLDVYLFLNFRFHIVF